jgi:hypothetical protein
MKAALYIEWLGAEEDLKLSRSPLWGGPPIRRPWVARVVGKHASGKLNRVFLEGSKDNKHSNSKGSRGVNLCFILETNYLYEVRRHLSWRSSKQYFCAVTELGDVVELSEKEAMEWLSAL